MMYSASRATAKEGESEPTPLPADWSELVKVEIKKADAKLAELKPKTAALKTFVKAANSKNLPAKSTKTEAGNSFEKE